MSGPIAKAVAAALRSARSTSTPEGRMALGLAARLDDPDLPASAVAGVARELRELLADVREAKRPEASPLDEIRKRRERRVGRAEA